MPDHGLLALARDARDRAQELLAKAETNAAAAMSATEVAAGTMPANVCNMAAAMSATVTTSTVSAAASESVSGER
jgi:hypothetical protein